MTAKLDYESAVFADDVFELANAIYKVVQPHVEEIKDDRIRNGLVAAAFVSVAQHIDETTEPLSYKPCGVTGMIRGMAERWKPDCGEAS